MLENRRDKEATKAWKKEVRKAGFKPDPRSYISISGHIYLAGPDRERNRAKVFAEQTSCQMCGRKHASNEGEYDHIKGGRPTARCDCFHRVLADGSSCTNVQRLCGRFMVPPCHTEKHHRTIG